MLSYLHCVAAIGYLWRGEHDSGVP